VTITPPERRTLPQGFGHLLAGTGICLATMLLFLAFRNSLPERVPLQLRLDGSLGNFIPRDLFVFGLPLAFAAVNLFFGQQYLASGNSSANYRPYKFYVVPAIMILLSALTLFWTLR